MTTTNTYYVISSETKRHGFTIIDHFLTENDAQTKINDLLSNKFYADDNLQIHTVKILNVNAHYINEEEGAEIDVKALINDESVSCTYNVQLVGTDYLSQMGCWITTNAGDREFTKNEALIFECADIITSAENDAKQYMQDNFEDIDAGFNCSFDSQELYIRINKSDDTAQLVLKDKSFNHICDYGQSEYLHEQFENKEEAFEFLQQFRTDEYHDVQGLHAYLEY